MLRLAQGEMQCLKNALQLQANMPEPVRSSVLRDMKAIMPNMNIDNSDHARRLSSYLSASLGSQPYDDDFIRMLRGRIKGYI
jgi:hypothetical protein